MHDIDELFAAARDAATRAYAPYSRFAVGAGLRLADGSIVTGANVENASYGLSLCAEAVALAKAANDGRLGEVREVAVVGLDAADTLTPCGRCRQMLNEAADVGGCDITVHVTDAAGTRSALPLSALLPRAFGPSDLVLTGSPPVATGNVAAGE